MQEGPRSSRWEDEQSTPRNRRKFSETPCTPAQVSPKRARPTPSFSRSSAATNPPPPSASAGPVIPQPDILCSLVNSLPSKQLGSLPDAIRKVLERTNDTSPFEETAPAATINEKIGENSKGFKMLKKAGWKEGETLGKTTGGLLEPIKPTCKTVFEKEEPPAEDSEAEKFRLRMMAAYRLRPNPNNNPRRSYDGYKTIYDGELRQSVVQALQGNMY